MSTASPLRLGELLTHAGLLSHASLDAALSRQAGRHVRLGELLVEMGLLERDELAPLLALQAELRLGTARPQLDERLRIGRLLVEAGVINDATLEQALGASRRSGRRLGETLVQLGALPAELLQRFLDRQRRLTAVALAGMALAAGVLPPAEARDRSQVRIQATVLGRAFIETQRLPEELVISVEDVARGYVELEEAVLLGIRSNRAVVLTLLANAPQIEAVHVTAVEGARASASGVLVPQLERGMRSREVSLTLRLRLAPDAAAGVIRFPIAASLSPD